MRSFRLRKWAMVQWHPTNPSNQIPSRYSFGSGAWFLIVRSSQGKTLYAEKLGWQTHSDVAATTSMDLMLSRLLGATPVRIIKPDYAPNQPGSVYSSWIVSQRPTTLCFVVGFLMRRFMFSPLTLRPSCLRARLKSLHSTTLGF
jgi:hypothetical protein